LRERRSGEVLPEQLYLPMIRSAGPCTAIAPTRTAPVFAEREIITIRPVPYAAWECDPLVRRIHWQGHVPRRTLAQLSAFQGRVAPDAHIHDETTP
jgi:hypothetical protein